MDLGLLVGLCMGLWFIVCGFGGLRFGFDFRVGWFVRYRLVSYEVLGCLFVLFTTLDFIWVWVKVCLWWGLLGYSGFTLGFRVVGWC